MWKSVKNWLQEWVFNIYKWKLGRSRWIAYFENYLHKQFGDRYGKFPTICRKIFPQDFPKLDPDWLAPHHPIPNAKFPPITAFLKLAFSPPLFPARFSCKIFLQDFPARFPTRFSRKIFLTWILIGWHPITLFQTLNFHPSLPFLSWLFPLLYFPQDFPARISCKIFPQDFSKLDPDWLAPHHPIPNAKFPPITAFLKLAFSPPLFPARFSCKIFLQDFLQDFSIRFSHKISYNNFPQDFPTRFFQPGSWLVGSPSSYSKW